MGAKTIIFILLGMSLSFSIVLGLMVALFEPAPAPRAKTRKALARASRAQITTKRSQSSPKKRPDAPQRAAPSTSKQPLQQLALDLEKQILPTPEQQSRLDSFNIASEQIQLAKKDLKKQLVSLERERDKMVHELAQKLTPMTPSNAAGELRILDDEATVLVLGKLTAAHRSQVLEHMEPQRARRLSRRMQRR